MRFIVPSIVALGLASACTPAATTPQLTVDKLTGAPWQVISINGVDAKTSPTIEFGSDGRASGNASCNRFSAEFKVDGAKLTFGKAISTMMACIEPDAQETEQRFLATLADVEPGEIASDGSLVLHAKNDGCIMARRS
jgi:heat shock protein HslJ